MTSNSLRPSFTSAFQMLTNLVVLGLVIWKTGTLHALQTPTPGEPAKQKPEAEAVNASGQPLTISAAEARSLVRVVLRHEKIHLSSRYCELEQLDKDGKAFVADSYSFGAFCDYPNTAATTPFGLYVVSPRTGDVWEFNRCQWFSFPELRRLQRNIMRRIHATAAEQSKYRERTRCVQGK